MMLPFSAVFHSLGLIVMIVSGLMLFPLALAQFTNDGAAGAFLQSFGLTLTGGALMWLVFRRFARGRELKIRDGFLLASLAWIVVPAVATLPLLMVIPDLSFTDAYFETMSGLTTTGSTTISDLDKLPASINFWRCFLVWIGGMGVVVLTVAILPMLGVGGSQAFKAETPGPMKDSKITPRITQTAEGLWAVYVLISLACIISLCLAGMPLLDSVMHTFSIMGLGGFSSHDASFGFF